ncbi:MAG: hypothetical protein L0Y71_15790 [Gemmataceae bacterium]|nr:hypothetical protein [Gemmataceae bacterium]
MIMVWTYLAYLAISIGLTVWVAHTLHKNGRIFLVDSFLGHEKLADSVNHLLVVGFYLINIGAVSVALKYGAPAANAQEAIEYLSFKLGLVLLILGVMHFGNLVVFTKMRKRALNKAEEAPVVTLADGAEARAPRYLERLDKAKRHAFE